jgi:NAD(P)-dependent dehydrogenase (short-subunit alcohol dehydrogenase family)
VVATEPWWGTGTWVGPAELGHPVCAALGDVAASWGFGAGPASVVLNGTALDDQSDIAAMEAVFEGTLAGAEKPARIISLVWDSWLGRGLTGRETASSAAAVGLARNWALRLAPTPTTVNVIALPSGFPNAAPAPNAPVQIPTGIEDLAHVVRFFGHPDNGYIIGQVVSLGGGDLVWSNHSL